MFFNFEHPFFRVIKKTVSRIFPITILFSALALLVFGVIDRIHPPSAVRADITTATWDGGAGDGLWASATNWSDDAVPDENKNVVIDLDAGVIVTAPGSIVFNNLTIGGTASASNTLVLTGSTSGTNVTIDNNGTIQQNSSSTNTIVGTLTVKSGGVLTHTANGAAHHYSVNFAANAIDVQSGGSVNVNGKGYSGALDVTSPGYGPGGGAAHYGGAGGGYGGDGGNSQYGAGGVGYCSSTNIRDLGSAGGPFYGRDYGGAGGGLIVLHATGSMQLAGTITANGNDGPSGWWGYSGAGSGGGVELTADTITGTPSVSANGGGVPVNTTAGGGGGGCLAIHYTSGNSVTSDQVSMTGGYGGTQYSGQDGGTGMLFIQHAADAGDLFLVGSSRTPANSTQLSSALSLSSITISSGSRYVVPSSRILTVTNANPFLGNSSGTLTVYGTLTPTATTTLSNMTFSIGSGGTLTTQSALNIANTGGLILNDGALLSAPITTLNSSGTLDVYYGGTSGFDASISLNINQSTTTLYNFSTSTALSLGSLYLGGTGTLTHAANTSTTANVINISAGSMMIDVGGSVVVSGRGFFGAIDGTSQAYGPGGGYDRSGGGHGGAGGNAGGAGGVAYCDALSAVETMGSSGGNYYGRDGWAAGGGLAMFTVSGRTTINGSVLANGQNGYNTGWWGENGAGAGGGVNIRTNQITGSPINFSVAGGNGTGGGASGGGGCVRIVYDTDEGFASSTVSVAGGTGGTNGGGAGAYVFAMSNSAPTASSYVGPVQSSTSLVTVTSTIADADSNATVLGVEYSTNNSDWVNATIATASENGEGDVTTSSGRIAGIDTDNDGSIDLTFTWDAATDLPNTEDSTVYLRITPNDGTASGTTMTSAAFSLDTKAPVAPGNLAINTTSTQSVTFTFGSAATDNNFKEYIIYYKTGASGVATSDSSFTSSTDPNLGAIDFNSTATTQLSGLTTSTQYVANIWAYDDIGHLTPAASEIAFYTLADAPGTPTVTASSSATILHLTIDKASNPTANVTYAICKTSNGTSCAAGSSYVQADGSLDTSAVWRTYAAWGGADGVEIVGLAPNTAYRFLVQAKNGDGVVTSLSSANSPVTTTDVGVTLSETTVATTEGGTTDSYTIVLDSKPTSTVQILLTTSAAQTISTSTIDFTSSNWNTPVTVTVTAADNATVDGTHTGTITHAASSTVTGYDAAMVISSVTNTVTDNDVAAAAQAGGGGGGLGAVGVPSLAPPATTYQIYDPITKTYVTVLPPAPPIELSPEILITPPIVSPIVTVPVQPKPLVPPAKKPYQFKRTLFVGVVGEDVRQLQIFLNNAGFTIAKSGPGSKGKETTRFGAATRTALIKFQKAHLKEILGQKAKPSQANGVFGPSTRKWVNGGGR